MERKHKQIDWWTLALKVVVVIYVPIVLAGLAINYFTAETSTQPERVSTEMIDDDKYLITYKQRIDRKTIYTSMIVDKEDNK